MTKKCFASLLAFALGCALLSGCGSSGTGSSGSSTASSGAETLSGESSSAKEDPEDVSGALPPEGTPVPEPDESLPFYLAQSTEEAEELENPYNPEGMSAFPGDTLNLRADASLTGLGEEVSIASSRGFYTISVDSAALTEERMPDLPADQVLRITYTYSSTDYDSELMVSSLFFRLYDAEGKACAPYLFSEKLDSAKARPLKPGESCTAAICFILPKDSGAATLVFDDLPEPKDPDECYWELSF